MWPFSTTPSWSTLAQEKVSVRNSIIKEESIRCRYDDDVTYLHATASEIVKRIEKGEWTAVDVLESYIGRAVKAQEKTNCLTEILFEDARKQAKALDEEFARTGNLKGPLHGVPISFKDCFDIVGYDTTMGFTGGINKPAKTNADILTLTKSLGAIPLAKTNLPQTMMFFECTNPIWGRTLNPYSEHHTSGGSSGGEGSLLALNGSVIGFGTDVGGSLRIPASWCGIYSIKPGWGRVSTVGARETWRGLEAVHGIAGPLARSIEDIELACKVLFGVESSNGSSNPAPIPYRKIDLPQKLKFGYYVSDGFVKASPACQRAVLESIAALRRQGHECVEIAIPNPERPIELFLSLASADGFKTVRSFLGNDPLQYEATMTIRTPSLWGWVRNTIAWIVKTVLGDPMASKVVLSEQVRSVEEFWKLTVERDEYVKLIYKTIWDEHNLDGIICPVIATPALPHTAVSFVGGIANSTILYNIVDSPVGVIPVTRVNPSLDNLTPEWTNHSIGSGHGSSSFEGLLYKGEKAIYDAKKMEGLPVGIQIVGRRWEEEKVIEMMKVVEGALKTMRKLELEGVDSVKSNIHENLKDVDNGYTRVSMSLGHVHGNASL